MPAPGKTMTLGEFGTLTQAVITRVSGTKIIFDKSGIRAFLNG
jgi:hypothetical protein